MKLYGLWNGEEWWHDDGNMVWYTQHKPIAIAQSRVAKPYRHARFVETRDEDRGRIWKGSHILPEPEWCVKGIGPDGLPLEEETTP